MLEDKNLFGISFDSVALSGLTVEFIKIAKIFKNKGFNIFFELGYDIKSDKNNFFKKYSYENNLFPPWIEIVRLENLHKICGYHQEFVDEVLNTLIPSSISTNENSDVLDKVETISDCICELFLQKWEELKISFIVIENGTLPENIMFTKALYKAIEIYGKKYNLGKFVLWRDHDLMWSSEPNTNKYGSYPYHYSPKLKKTNYIQYIVLHEADLKMALNWCPEANVAVLPNTFQVCNDASCSDTFKFREYYSIPEDALLLARFTRFIPQKRVDRDIVLLAKLVELFKKNNIKKEIFIFISGSLDENREEYLKLVQLAQKLEVEKYIVFDQLLPYCINSYKDEENEKVHFSIRNLLEASDLCCFLTSYNYESYGNPVSEAIITNTPYISTKYERYDVVYGSKGFKGILLEVDEYNDDSITVTDEFVNKVYEFLLDKKNQNIIAEYNFDLAQKCFSNDDVLKNNIENLFPDL